MSTAESGRETEKFSARVSDEYAPSVLASRPPYWRLSPQRASRSRRQKGRRAAIPASGPAAIPSRSPPSCSYCTKTHLLVNIGTAQSGLDFGTPLLSLGGVIGAQSFYLDIELIRDCTPGARSHAKNLRTATLLVAPLARSLDFGVGTGKRRSRRLELGIYQGTNYRPRALFGVPSLPSA